MVIESSFSTKAGIRDRCVLSSGTRSTPSFPQRCRFSLEGTLLSNVLMIAECVDFPPMLCLHSRVLYGSAHIKVVSHIAARLDT
jgi:hypothetical protein